jgi:predicted nucleotidyltransferase component of viral defense system
MTNEIKELLERIKNHPVFDTDTFFFVGGTALSAYLNHRVSYDIDIASTCKLPVSQIKAFAFGIGAREIKDKNASVFRINTGDDIENYHLKFMVHGIKLEFSYFQFPVQTAILQNGSYKPYDENSKLKILALKDIISLKIFALFNRQKTRDLFDASIILEKNLLDIGELERIYSYMQVQNNSIRDYIATFKAVDDDGDNSLDFLSEHEYYKVFAKKSQNERFIQAKEMFLDQYDKKQKEALATIKKVAVRNKRVR